MLRLPIEYCLVPSVDGLFHSALPWNDTWHHWTSRCTRYHTAHLALSPRGAMEEECTATLISSTDLKGSEFVCRCHPEDALRWSLYSGDYVILKGGGEVECLQAIVILMRIGWFGRSSRFTHWRYRVGCHQLCCGQSSDGGWRDQMLGVDCWLPVLFTSIGVLGGKWKRMVQKWMNMWHTYFLLVSGCVR